MTLFLKYKSIRTELRDFIRYCDLAINYVGLSPLLWWKLPAKYVKFSRNENLLLSAALDEMVKDGVLRLSEDGKYSLVEPVQQPIDWRRCEWGDAEQYRSRVLTGSIGLENPWTEWLNGRPERLAMNQEYEYRVANQHI